MNEHLIEVGALALPDGVLSMRAKVKYAAAVIAAVEPLIIANEQERLRNQIIPLLRTSGVNHKSQARLTEADLGYDMGLDTVLDMLGWGCGHD